MSKNNISINDSILLQSLKPSINFVSLKARLRLNELKRNFSDLQYKNYYKKGLNIVSVSTSMTKKHSIKDLYHKEKNNSFKINTELGKINKGLISFKKKYKIKNKTNKYKLKLFDDSKEKERIKYNNLIKSVKEDISKYLKYLHMNDSKITNKRLKFKELKLSVNPIIKPKLIKKATINNSLDICKFLNNAYTPKENQNININKNKIKKFISIEGNSEDLIKFKSQLNFLSDSNEKEKENEEGNEEEKYNKKSLFIRKKFPFLRQNSCVPFVNQGKLNNKFQINESNSINLPNL